MDPNHADAPVSSSPETPAPAIDPKHEALLKLVAGHRLDTLRRLNAQAEACLGKLSTVAMQPGRG
jgi:hypothetical protein